MKAILINPEKKEVTEVEYSGDYQDIYKLIDCKTFDIVRTSVSNDGVYVDDEGLFAKEQAYWKFDYCNDQPHIKLVNKGLVLGCNDEGDSIAPESTVDYIKSRIIWRW